MPSPLSDRVLRRLTPALLLLAACLPASAADDTPKTATAADFEAAIARLEKLDPSAPQALNARLQYAGFLTDSTTGDCHARLDAAQAQLDAVSARPAAQILLPLGAARLKGGAYKIHAARADCMVMQRIDELHKALDAARDATRLYRDGLDYQSAAIMQFNTAATLRALGDNDGAITALNDTIALDRAFGFRDDGKDNLTLLQHWQGGDESDTHITELMRDFPTRTADFKFAWTPGDSQMAIAATETNLVAGQVVQSNASITVPRQLRPQRNGWAVHYDSSAKARLDLGHWPTPGDPLLERFTAYLLAIAVLETPDYSVMATGDFDTVKNPETYSRDLATEMVGAFGTPAQSDTATMAKALTRNLKTVLLPYYLATNTAQNHSLQTATWAGAKLEQGVWYQMTAPLLLPGVGLGQYFLVTHDIAFSYARDAAKTCAEIVIRATPVPADMAKAHTEMSSVFRMPDFDALHYWSSITARLVVRPATLEPVISDIRKSWYVAVDAGPKADPTVSSERVVTTMTYTGGASTASRPIGVTQ